ncbi:hypothetical protein [Bosea sp. WAO]|uniref:hypothetical protein n=1 Tax=Bosea sp. WAO TaxID=406341 RepID=UPI000B1E4558|nr:hypothetical protein [Bosea sp. WAO]
MKALISLASFILLVLGGWLLFVAGGLDEEGNRGSAAFSASLATLILLMSWVLA